MIIDRGFYVDNYVGTYHMEYNERLNTTLIVSDQHNYAKDEEILLPKKRIFSFEAPDDFLFLRLANLDITKDEEILAYCNEFGLPYSTQVCNDVELRLGKDTLRYARNLVIAANPGEYGRKDTMTREEFCRLATNVRKLMEFKMTLDQTEKTISDDSVLSLLYYLVYFTLFSHQEIYDYNETDPIPQTRTVRFQYAFHLFRRKNCGVNCLNDSIEYQLHQYLIYCERILSEPETVKDISVLSDLLSATTVLLREFYFTLIKKEAITYDGWLSGIMDGKEDVPRNVLKLINRNNLKSICVKVFGDIVNEGLVNVHPILSVTLLNGLSIAGLWKLNHQMEGIYMELFIELSKNSQYRLCDNPSCGNLFSVSRSRSNKRFCCHECAVLQAKRNERKRKKEQLVKGMDATKM